MPHTHQVLGGFFYTPFQLNDQVEYNNFLLLFFCKPNSLQPPPLFTTFSPRSLGTKLVLPLQKKTTKIQGTEIVQ